MPLVLFFILPLVACPLWGQVVQKKQLTEADYHLWGELYLDKIAPNEKWVSFKMNYASGQDTLFVRNTTGTITYHFPLADQSVFTKDNLFICQIKEDLHTLNLQTGKKDIIPQVSEYSYSFSNNLLLLFKISSQNKSTLILKSPLGKTQREIADVTKFSLSPDGRQLIYNLFDNGKNSVLLTDLKNPAISKLLLTGGQQNYNNFTWQKEGKAVAFYAKSDSRSIESLLFYNLENDKLFELNPDKEPGLPVGSSIVDHSMNNIVIADDLQKVFFYLKTTLKPEISQTDSKVEIWNTNDKWIYPQEQVFGNFEQRAKVFLWQPMLKKSTPITTNELPAIMLSGNKQYAVLSNPKAYEPQFDFEGNRDFYAMNLNTYEKSIFLSGQSGFYLDLVPSPGGRYIAYFKKKNWWVYDLELKTHTDLTSKIGVSFAGKVHALKSDSAFGNPGWSDGDSEILLYDDFDIWAIKADGSSAKRLTQGRELGIKYRIAKKSNISLGRFIYDGQILDNYDLTKQMILQAEGADGKEGYYSWNKSTGEKPIFYDDSYMDQINYSSKKQRFFCMEQKFNMPPRIISKESSSAIKPIFQSNQQHYNYYWGRSELIHFQNSKKQNLKGVLYYPANFNPQKKYPMIVNIYETQSNDLHKYSNPTLYNEPGYNPALFTSQGYFLFLPDIVHENGNVGPSSTDCVVAGTEKVLELGLVDSQKIALMGHSFGGYETVFIANHTPLFATAIASGAITDLNSMFYSVGWNTMKPEMWRFATEEWRLDGKTPLANREDFDRNSPLESIDKLQIPLLMWSGKEDTQVDWHQSIEYYLALRRLGKKSIMLLYPKEGHSLTNPINQKDLTTRVLQWFAYYLKDDKTTEWINNGMQ
ncbi:prolyl oligopeptidase family serine peptidase [Flavobacterium sp. DGU38]|uniref:Prolyl oligopeptidase family serine peptidase n=1 Tax=Flavobacterium calami TaxID=3139144 RepID=A0ABU9INS1_9FLAO